MLCCLYTRIAVTDNGIGIFKNVVNAMKDYGFTKPTPEDAVIELYKGKFTSVSTRRLKPRSIDEQLKTP